MRSFVVYLYVSFDRLHCLEDNLLSAWYISILPTGIVRKTPHSIEALGISHSLLAKKAKLCFSDWLECVNEPQFSPSFGGDPTAPFLPPIPNWIEELKLTLFEIQYLAPYQTPVPPTASAAHIQT
ncbi:hypothetical protein CsSME_00025283 [Camellia sinensis var. sinensis]